ncbi:MAG: adenylate/guanylate cyclase domain-containing protein [Desulfohalobiaceae bacterium]|nr:adenylate/guanylate cyclase domain-containing protein [Desulfohalobiaceae bacterium]
MKKSLAWYKNMMLAGNLAANVGGIALVSYFLTRPFSGFSPVAWDLLQQLAWFFDPLALAAMAFVTYRYERAIRRFVNMQREQQSIPQDLRLLVRRRVLNEPFFLIALNLCFWLVAGVFYATAFLQFGLDLEAVRSVILRSLFTAMVTIIAAFFVLQFLKRKWLVPYFFPHGGLYNTPGTLRIRISTRLAAMLCACNILPLLAILYIFHLSSFSDQQDPRAFQHLSSAVTWDILIFIGLGIGVTILVSRNLSQPMYDMIRVLRRVQHGDLEKRVQVTTNDEIGYCGDVINEMTQGLEELDFIKETFGKYVSGEVRDEILSGEIPLDGESKEVTVLFADLRDFSRLVESLPPRELVRIINFYFTEMEKIIHDHQGLVLQYIGDEIEAVFGAPLAREDHASLAVRAALSMQKRLQGVNETLKQSGHQPLLHGIGIHSGRALAANIGSPNRLSYALVGDTVNLASRLQELSKKYDTQIVLSRATGLQLDEDLRLRPLPPARVKGIDQSVEIFTPLL